MSAHCMSSKLTEIPTLLAKDKTRLALSLCSLSSLFALFALFVLSLHMLVSIHSGRGGVLRTTPRNIFSFPALSLP